MSAGRQQPRRQVRRRSSHSLPRADASIPQADTAAANPAAASRKAKPPRPPPPQQQDVAAAADAVVAKASKRLKAVNGTPAVSTDTADRDTGRAAPTAAARGSTSAAMSRRGSPAGTAAAATPALQQQPQQVAAPSGPESSSTAGTAPSSGGMSAFEAERAARIAANLARLAALEIPDIAADLAASVPPKHKAAPTQKGVGTKRKRSEAEQQPLRRSGRHRGEAPDPTTAGGIDYEGKDGKIVLAAVLHHLPMHTATTAASREAAAAVAAAAAAALSAPVPFRSSNGDEASDAAFLALLRSQAAAAAATNDSSGSDTNKAAAAVTGHELVKLSLSAADVAKMTRDGVSCMAFHPGTDKLIIAAADKQGKVGLWDIDHPQQQQQQQQGVKGASSSSSYDGVLMFEAHRDYVSSMKWLRGGSALMTGSYDGTVRLMDVETGIWEVVPGLPADSSWSAGDATPDGSVLYLATSDGDLTLHDTRTDNSSSTWDIANRKVNTLHLHSNMYHLASSSSDGTVAVWDVRQLGATRPTSGSSSKTRLAKSVCKVSHQKSSQGAYWCPDGGCRLLSISFDDTLRVWKDPAGKGQLQQELVIRHNNNTGRWVVPFRPAWSPAGDAVIVGDLKRGVALFDSNDGKQLGLLQAEALTAIPSRMALHPNRDVKVLAAATSSGRVHIWR